MNKLRRLYTKLNRHRNSVNKKSMAKSKSEAVRRQTKFYKTGAIKQYDASTASLSDLQSRGTSGSTIQWVRVFHEAGVANQPQEYVFNKNFRHACFTVVLNMQDSGIKSANARDITNKGFEIDTDNDLTGDKFINYIAIGY
jgi:hypothetical protein